MLCFVFLFFVLYFLFFAFLFCFVLFFGVCVCVCVCVCVFVIFDLLMSSCELLVDSGSRARMRVLCESVFACVWSVCVS